MREGGRGGKEGEGEMQAPNLIHTQACCCVMVLPC